MQLLRTAYEIPKLIRSGTLSSSESDFHFLKLKFKGGPDPPMIALVESDGADPAAINASQEKIKEEDSVIAAFSEEVHGLIE